MTDQLLLVVMPQAEERGENKEAHEEDTWESLQGQEKTTMDDGYIHYLDVGDGFNVYTYMKIYGFNRLKYKILINKCRLYVDNISIKL